MPDRAPKNSYLLYAVTSMLFDQDTIKQIRPLRFYDAYHKTTGRIAACWTTAEMK